MVPGHPNPPVATLSAAPDPANNRVFVTTESRPLGFATILARHTLGGHLTGYLLRLDDGTRYAAAPRQIHPITNIAAPPPSFWRRPATTHPHPPAAA
jgi:hypothetical protein